MFGLFVIEAGQEPIAVLNCDSKPLIFDTGSDAACAAAAAARGDLFTERGYLAFKCQPRRLASDAWKARELGRFADGTYIALPWADLPKLAITADHFAHVSTEDGAKIAYTQDAAKGAGDIQTRVKPGRYLTQFYGDTFDAPTIARMAAEFDTQHGESLELQFADTEDEIERVYTDGPSSCMSKDASYYESPIHPTRVYAAGDLAVAYLVRNDEITARALCWPAKKLYGRIYGDETRLSDLLESASFREGDLDGARMLRVEHRNALVVPYIDGCQCASDNGEFLILGERGVDGGQTNGLSGPTLVCEACGEGIDDEDCSCDDDGNSYCDCCYSDRFSRCERYDEECSADEVHEVICNSRYNGSRTAQYWGQRAIDDHAFECEGNGKLYSNDFRVELADGTVWSQDYFEDNGTVCDGSGECIALDDTVQLEDGTVWSKDYFSDNGVTIDGKLYAKSDAPETDDVLIDRVADKCGGVICPDGAPCSCRDWAADRDEETKATSPSYRYHWKPSPYVACADQLELVVPIPLHIAGPDSDGDYVVMRGSVRQSPYCSSRADAETYLRETQDACAANGAYLMNSYTRAA